MSTSIFFAFNLPNSATWFYFSIMLTVAIAFQFHRVFSLRNFDLLSLFLFVPGFLLLQDANTRTDTAGEKLAGYSWLLAISGVWLVRCLADLGITRRTVFRANWNTASLIWFMVALFICLSAVAIRRPADTWEPVGRPPATILAVSDGATAVVAETTTDPNNTNTTRDARFWVERVLAMAGHLAIVAGLVFIGWQHFRHLETGVAMGVLYLVIPYTAFHIAQLHHVLPAALTLWAVKCYRKPRVAGMLIGFAAGTTFFPILLLPLWCRFYWKRGVNRFLSGFLFAGLIALAITLSVLWFAGLFPVGLSRVLHLADWQPWLRPSAESVWQGVHWAYRVPVFLAYVVLVVSILIWSNLKTVSHVTAASAAFLIGIQFWFADRGGLYVLWYTPLLICMVLRPSTTDLEPPSDLESTSLASRFQSIWLRFVGKRDNAPPPTLAA